MKKRILNGLCSDLVSENKLSAKATIQSLQTEKVKGIWLGGKKKSVELSSIVHFIRKTKMNYYRNFQLTGSPHGK